MYYGLRYFAVLKHRLIGSLFVYHIDGCEQFELVFVRVNRQFVKGEQHPFDLLLANRILEKVEQVFLL